MNTDLRKFFVRFAFFLPFLLIAVAFPTVVLIRSGELITVDAAVEAQADKSRVVIFGKAYSGKMGYYALRGIYKQHPDVISLGSSRVMAFRSKFFRPEVKFYNAGGASGAAHEFLEFLNRLPSKNGPKVMIIGLDQTYLNKDWLIDPILLNNRKIYDVDITSKSIWMSSFNRVIDDYWKGKFLLREIFSPQSSDIRKIGLNAIMNEHGTINDGSQHYGGRIRYPEKDPDYQFAHSLNQISKGEGFFYYGDKISEEALRKLNIFLEECQRRKVYVIAFLPPFPHRIYEAMKSSGRYHYQDHLKESLEPVFARYGFSFFDFSDLASVGASDDETYDGYHGSEKAYLRLFLKMAEKDPVLNKMTDKEYLQKRLSESDNPYTVFDIREL